MIKEDMIEIEKANNFLKKIKIKEDEELLKDTARLNILNIIKKDDDETYVHSLILEEIFKWKNIFFPLFLEKVLKFGKDEIQQITEGNYSIYREKLIKDGRIDFVIESENLCIAIEMKIYSGDQYKQLERYEKYCKNRKKIDGTRKEYYIYYLTLLKDEKPSEQSIGKMNIEKLKNISFEKDILMWLKSGLKFIENEKYRSNFIISYISTIENLVYKEEKMKDSIKTVEDARAARLIKEGLLDKMQEILSQFLESIRQNVEENSQNYEDFKIRKSFNYDGTESFYKPSKDGIAGTLFIFSKTKKDEKEYCSSFQIEVNKNLQGYFGFKELIEKEEYTKYEFIKFEKMEEINPSFYKKWIKKFEKIEESLDEKELNIKFNRKDNLYYYFNINSSTEEKFDFKNLSDSTLRLIDENIKKDEILYISNMILNILKEL